MTAFLCASCSTTGELLIPFGLLAFFMAVLYALFGLSYRPGFSMSMFLFAGVVLVTLLFVAYSR